VSERYEQPRAVDRAFNSLVAALTRAGVSVWGSRVLEVRGRKSGEPRRNPVNLLTHEGARYLVAPRGNTQWARNVRAAGEAVLIVGRRREQVKFSEVTDEAKPPILRAYLRRWKWEVGQFFQGVGPEASDDELLAISPGYPVFEVRAT
jgi:deazaflavin-dependent oxidoreductase (nitroreductase family)